MIFFSVLIKNIYHLSIDYSYQKYYYFPQNLVFWLSLTITWYIDWSGSGRGVLHSQFTFDFKHHGNLHFSLPDHTSPGFETWGSYCSSLLPAGHRIPKPQGTSQNQENGVFSSVLALPPSHPPMQRQAGYLGKLWHPCLPPKRFWWSAGQTQSSRACTGVRPSHIQWCEFYPRRF